MAACRIPEKTYPNKLKDLQSMYKLCRDDGLEANYTVMNEPLKSDRIHIWAIPSGSPTDIHFYPLDNEHSYVPCNVKDRVRPNGSERKTNMIHHNYLVEGKPVVCAGETGIHSVTRKRWISNKSGHYTPDNDCLTYAKCLFETKGTRVENVYSYKGGARRRKTRKRVKK